LKHNQDLSAWYGTEHANGFVAPVSYRLDDLKQADELSERDAITLLALHAAIAADQVSSDQASVFLLHTAALHFLPLRHRRFPKQDDLGGNQDVMLAFSQSAASFLHNSSFRDQLDGKQLPCDLADLLDGFLLATITHNGELSLGLLVNDSINTKFDSLRATLSNLCGRHIGRQIEGSRSVDQDIRTPMSPVSIERAVLPFKNSVFDKHLEPVHLRIDEDPSTRAMLGQSKVFKELSHWHNHRRAIVQKGPPPRDGWFARRRNQWFMAEMLAYAASLTNAAGKVLEPETIVPGQSSQTSKPAKIAQSSNAVDLQQSAQEKAPKGGKKTANPTKKGGKAAALEAAAAIKAGKTQSKADIASTFWKTKCKEITSQADPQIRYTSAKKFFHSLSTDEATVLSPEVELFMIDCLLRIWTESRKSKDAGAGIDIAALIWDAYLRLSKLEAGMSPAIVTNLEAISKMLGFPAISFKANSADRPLAFTVAVPMQPKQKSAATTNSDVSIPGGARDFQLEHCGPYFDRAIDSAPDHRVPFQPDGWQRKVLDAIDAGKSLFVVAPTSAGKTFISFYAMKKVLEANDDDVVVYVAPTKALVNQIAAETQARFSKAFKHAGRSVWGIHTRDYRINNPTGCQVLVTVPHILQIMLLAPSHAEKKNSWSYRIKCIIFDEVHCIGQADDGLIWEQLLLQAPCPIIALSATVGNPKEFSDWLGSTQAANGHELVTVEHQHRYSDLRKFIYVPPEKFCFSGLPDLPLIHTPGLDGTDAFAFVHPVASLVNRSRGMPNDLTLEARDCLRLWQGMTKYETKEHPLPSRLNPDRALPSVVRKVDILKWEADLKDVLRRWMADDNSPFEKVHRELSVGLSELSSRKVLTTKHECDDKCQERRVKADDLISTVLPALVDLHSKDALPAIVFNYDRGMCEKLAKAVIQELEKREEAWKQSSPVWKKKAAEFERWSKNEEAIKDRAKAPKKVAKKKDKRGDGDDEGGDEDEKLSKAERNREAGGIESSKWAGFDPRAPIDGFHFADVKRLAPSELQDYQRQLRNRGVDSWLIHALGRGIGVHHAGMNRKYRQVVEMLFRKGFLRVVIATGTLALGINMPCKTVVFAGDSVFLTALNFRQGAGRAGRRGFDVLGNVVFLGITPEKVFRLLSSRLPDLNGHFPITTSLVLRLATLLQESNNSKFAIRTINSILSQPRLYLGSPDSKMAVLHHLRFSIEYLRRQSLLDTDGAPLNFAGCVSHLYYTENAGWAFHALLSSGYFHDLCQDIDANPERVCLTLMLVLSHIFGRQLCKRADKDFVEEVVKHSSSIVFLPPLPKQAEEALRAHNAETLAIFRTYVKTYADQHLHKSDDKLPLTQLRIGSDDNFSIPANISLSPTVVRSPFVALSGHGDEFDTISDLCSTVRSGVFLEEAVVPYLPIYPEESDVPLNAYLYDFYKHGDINALEQANRIRTSDVWFHLNGKTQQCTWMFASLTLLYLDFSLVLATIITSLTNFVKLSPNSDAEMIDVMGSGDTFEEQQDDKAIDKQEAQKAGINKESVKESGKPMETSDEVVGVPDSWDTAAPPKAAASRAQSPAAWADGEGEKGLLEVLKAFKILQEEFNGKFKKMWA
jgi:superfamily II RNA helicase